MGTLNYTITKGTVLGTRRGGEPIVYDHDVHVEVRIDDQAVRELARQAARNKTGRARSGPAVAFARHRR